MLANREFWAGKRVLLTGHTGFKGSWLALWLTELGAVVTGISLEPNTTPNLFSQLDLAQRLGQHHIADINNSQALNEIVYKCQPQVVFHLAAQPLVRHSYQDPLGTWATNVMGSLNLLEALKPLQHQCAVVMVTTDKVYENQEWDYGYRENDRLGGHDPYSASKAAAEIAIASWRSSFCGHKSHQTPYLAIATARAGNVIGGGDWAKDRIMPDAMRGLAKNQPIIVRNPKATRPWQHVLEPLGGYLLLAEALTTKQINGGAFNFGPQQEANRSVQELIEESIKYWPGEWQVQTNSDAVHEAGRLHLQIDKAHQQLKWKSRWGFKTTIEQTVSWYQALNSGGNAMELCLVDLKKYSSNHG